jgi:type II secretory ATPase GspE/PulE/Tfp pilus assembly ATPase PilB-like protein
VKVMAEMDISERRKPLDGHIELPSAEEELHFRVSTLPVVHGEKCVIRLLRKEGHLADLARLGFDKHQHKQIVTASALPQGLILVTGPTGSGKTTTLHAVLNHINDPDTNIVTIEDPVEQTLPGINHVQVQEKGGVTFSSALRAILRQDPDIVFVGEMRDPEVAAIAVKAALTGHLVLSTLHTNGTAETFARLADMGLPSYLVASSVQLVVAQRLVRRVCSCAVPAPIDTELVERFGLTEEQLVSAVLKKPVGCPRCHGTGYKGRVAVYEMVAPSPALREVLRTGGGETEIIAAMNAEGVKWMWDSGVARALAGETTLEEVARTINPPAR